MSAISSDRKIDDSELGMTERALNRRRGRWVPWIIVLFYMTFMSALVSFVFIAYAHPPAESTSEAYEKGLAYNSTIEKGTAQAQLGWQSTIDYSAQTLTFTLKDRAGAPLTGATVQSWFVHPGNPADDRNFALRDQAGGTYISAAPLPAKGVWTIHVTAEKAGRQYQAIATTEVE